MFALGARPHSALNAIAVGVPAAIRPGNAAITLAKTNAPRATRTTDNTGTVGSGHCVDIPGK